VAASRRARRPSRAGADIGAAVGGVAGVEHDEARIVDPAVGIFEALRRAGFSGAPAGHPAQIERRGRRQQLAAADMVVEEQAERSSQAGRSPLL
jgi:hypothetical protein